jgi:hypothetical protein
MVRQKAELDAQKRKRMEEIYKRRKMGDLPASLPAPTAQSTTIAAVCCVSCVIVSWRTRKRVFGCVWFNNHSDMANSI